MEASSSRVNSDDMYIDDESRGVNVGTQEVVEEPKVGMTFASEDEVRAYYTKYAKIKGFGVSKRSSRPGDDGKLRYFILACVRQGTAKLMASNVLRPRPIERFGCKAKINATLSLDGRYKLSTVILEHTHTLSPGKARFFRCNRKMDSAVKKQLDVGDSAGINVSKSFKSFVVKTGGYENLTFGEKDCRNYLDKARQLRLGEGGVEALRKYFVRMQQKNYHFYYIMDLDDEGRLRNVFWADARSRIAYKYFGDVITFDTTYLMNRYKMPFAPFVGVNHHGQSILFGCGLISSEDVNTFVWLFESWLTCTEGQASLAIITDQDKAMQIVIATVFPTSRHRFCLWHILKKLPEKFGSHSHYESIKSRIQNCVYDCLTTKDFEESWETLLDTYNLHDNVWLEWLYDERHMWVPAYVRDTFWAGMSTTQRSESMNAFFNDYVNSKTSLKQFVEQYDNALRRKVENETAADFSSFHTQFPCITHYEIEKQFQSLYTNAKFKEVQDEFRGFIYCRPNLVNCEGVVQTYRVSDEVKVCDGFIKRVNFSVTYTDEDDFAISCNCKLFEFRGILCRHALCVLTMFDKRTLPLKYIVNRWRKDLKRNYTLVKSSYDDRGSNPKASRYDMLTRAFGDIAEDASETEESCKRLMGQLAKLRLDHVRTGNRPFSGNDANHNYVDACAGMSCESTKDIGSKVYSPLVVRSKGRPPSKRKVSVVEKAVNKCKARKKKNSGWPHDSYDRQVDGLQ
ncbi:hypothetical protein I3842_06G042300 [Carya illinoinensis]|uniref:Protein FAR1-RELATED SEQUENCE n=1 Tax=Carya illinoinensis TaxID=32201 RepID=A0A922EU32_CARIL|nr:hypothetical protein I3842_06G042300 [Carya illinoinensis]